MKIGFAAKQLEVDTWMSPPNPFGYRGNDKVFEKIEEEIGETKEALELHLTSHTPADFEELQKEIGDILFAVICLANNADKKPRISLDECLDLSSYENVLAYGGYYHMVTAMIKSKDKAQKTLATYIESSNADDLTTLKIGIGHLLSTIIGLTEKLGISIDGCFDLMMEKNENRAKNGYKKEAK